MSGLEIITRLQSFTGRGAGTDAERRAATWLAREMAGRRRTVTVEPFWCRPNWALAQAWHAALALAGSLVAVASPRAGGAMLLAALVFVIADSLTGVSPGRRLTREHASQNVVGLLPSSGGDADRDGQSTADGHLHLVITANYDAGRTSLIYRDTLRSLTSRVRRATRALVPGWTGWLCIAILVVLAIAILRAEGHRSSGIGAAQLVPTIGLLLVFAVLLEMGTSAWSPGAGDNGSGVAVAVAVARALGVSPPRNLDVEVVLTGAADGEGVGLHHHLRNRRSSHRRTNTVVMGIAPCGAGTVRWWRSDGSLLPLRYGRRLVALARQVALQQPHLNARPHSGRGTAPALQARRSGIPAIAVGCLDERDLVPRSHRPTDLASAVAERPHDQAVQFVLMLVDAIDEALQDAPPSPPRRRPLAARPA
ncbi:MAG: M28 family peptidase [Solirubrobacteraceae bacterium]